MVCFPETLAVKPRSMHTRAHTHIYTHTIADVTVVYVKMHQKPHRSCDGESLAPFPGSAPDLLTVTLVRVFMEP